MSDYKHGSMDITEQKKTYVGFIKGCIWLCGISIGVLVFLAIFNS
ncbi:MAG: aa3-type cytochrome c oxidase subunit IV [Rhodobacteraceae bacterium]|nr:aa3-type cytochrome c oxidase subunit IV [Paracoccaceae bacterium]